MRNLSVQPTLHHNDKQLKYLEDGRTCTHFPVFGLNKLSFSLRDLLKSELAVANIGITEGQVDVVDLAQL